MLVVRRGCSERPKRVSYISSCADIRDFLLKQFGILLSYFLPSAFTLHPAII